MDMSLLAKPDPKLVGYPQLAPTYLREASASEQEQASVSENPPAQRCELMGRYESSRTLRGSALNGSIR
jgi:hypothetical protein